MQRGRLARASNHEAPPRNFSPPLPTADEFVSPIMVNVSRFTESIFSFLYGGKGPLQGIIVGSDRITRYTENARPIPTSVRNADDTPEGLALP